MPGGPGAWLLQHGSYLSGDLPEDSNPFLFEMFSHGCATWAQRQTRREAALLRGLGADVNPSGSAFKSRGWQRLALVNPNSQIAIYFPPINSSSAAVMAVMPVVTVGCGSGPQSEECSEGSGLPE